MTALITSHYGFLNTREAGTRADRAEADRYKRDRLKEQEQLFIEPLKREIEDLKSFIAAVANYYFIASSKGADDEAKLTAKVELMKVSGAAYRYEAILAPLASFHQYDGDYETAFDNIRSGLKRYLMKNTVNLARC